jgi:hypothetical protein
MFLEPEREAFPNYVEAFNLVVMLHHMFLISQKLDMCGFGFWGKKHESLL